MKLSLYTTPPFTMAISETTYLDRYGRAETMNTAIGAFLPAFAPANNNITPANFTAFLEEVDAANDAITTARDNYTDAVEHATIWSPTPKTAPAG